MYYALYNYSFSLALCTITIIAITTYPMTVLLESFVIIYIVIVV